MRKIEIHGNYPPNTINQNILQNKNNFAKSDFGEILREQRLKVEELKFSKHACQRLGERNINLSQTQIDKINNAINMAASKGIKDTLILMDNVTLIANIKNKTIVTVATNETLKNNVFTNIDGAVII